MPNSLLSTAQGARSSPERSSKISSSEAVIRARKAWVFTQVSLVPSGIQKLTTQGWPMALAKPRPISRQRLPCSTQKRRLRSSGLDRERSPSIIGWEK